MTNKEFIKICVDQGLEVKKDFFVPLGLKKNRLCAFFYINGRLHMVRKESKSRSADIYENYNRYVWFRHIYHDDSVANFTNRLRDVMNLDNVELNLAY